MSHGRYKTRCRIERYLAPAIMLVGEEYEKIVTEVVYDYGTKKAKRGYKLLVYLTEKNGEVADGGAAIEELYLGEYGNRFCQSGWSNARKVAGAKCSKLSDYLLERYGLQRLPIRIDRELKKGDTMCVGNLAFLELGERASRTDYSEKCFTLLEVDQAGQRYIIEPKVAAGEKPLPPQYMKFSNDHYVSKIY